MAPETSARFGRVAVVHDWLTGMRGGEAVLEGILSVVPQAEIFTLFHYRGSVSPEIESHVIHTSSLQGAAMRARDYRRLLPLFPRAAREWDLRAFDLIISSSHCVAKGVRAAGRPHLCYCHTPMRYIWDRFDDYFPRSKPVLRTAMLALAPWLRRWDVRTASEVTQFVANSSFVKERIGRYYDRSASVIYPYVASEFLAPPLVEEREDVHVIVSALVPYKNVELAVQAVRKTGRRLLVLGGGPLLEKYRASCGPNVTFAGSVSREEIIDRLSRARSLILPGVEDFGITPLEAMALGTPVVALGKGGVLDTVQDGVNGALFSHSTTASLAAALDRVESQSWDRAAIRAHAASFSRQRFESELRQAVEALVVPS